MDLRRIAILLLFAGVILFAGFIFGGRDKAESGPTVSPATPVVDAARNAGESLLAGKSRERATTADSDGKLQQMLDDLKATVPGLTEFPEQTLDERILATNSQLKKAGIALRFGVDEKLHPSQRLLEMKVPAFSQENATPNDILQNAHKALNKHYLLSNGTVLFQDGSGG